MKLQLFRFECKHCGYIFKSPELFGNPYGEFLLKTKTGKIAYLDAINSNVFKEVSELLKSNSRLINMSAAKRAKFLHRIFYIACDPADDGSLFSIIQKPVCQKCGQNNIGRWGPTEPSEFVDLDIPDIKYYKWSVLNATDKKLLLDQALCRIIQGEVNLT